jgi:hypothetical protein
MQNHLLILKDYMITTRNYSTLGGPSGLTVGVNTMDFAGFDEQLYGVISVCLNDNEAKCLDDEEDKEYLLDSLYDEIREFLKETGVYNN